MKNILLFVFAMLSVSLVSTTVFAQYGWYNVPFDWRNTMALILGMDPAKIPSDWLGIPNVIYFIIFPYIAIVTVLYGVFSEIRIFRSSTVKTILAIVIAGMSLPTGALISTVYWMYTIGAWVAVFGFGLVFILGAILWGVGRIYGLGSSVKDISKEIGAYNKQLAALDADYAAGRKKTEDYLKERGAIAVEKRKLLARLGVIEEVGGTEAK